MKLQRLGRSLRSTPLVPFSCLTLLILALIAVCVGSVQAAGNTLTLATVNAAPGSTGSFTITLDNSDAVASGQVRFTYAAALGLTITGVQAADRTTGFATTGSAYSTGNANLLGYQILFYNLNSLTVAPGSGVILTVSYTLAANATGSTPLRFTQSILSNPAAQSLVVTTADGTLTVTAPTATLTATASDTATSTPTVTETPVPPTATAVNTATRTPTALPTTTAAATQPPTATLTPVTTSTPTATAPTTPTATATNTATAVATVTPTSTPTLLPTVTPTGSLIYLSSSRNGRVDGLVYRDEDIIVHHTRTNGWQLFFDGSDVGLANADLDAFAFLPDGAIVMSFDKPVRFPTLGVVDDSDLVKFIPIQLGSNTIGRYELFFDGSDVELASSNEDIDAVAVQADGTLLISTYGRVEVGDFTALDEDLIHFTATTLGENTAGSWARYFDGSAIGLTTGSEDVSAVTVDSAGTLYLATKGNFTVSSLNASAGDSDDLLGCTLSAIGEGTTACTFFTFFDGDRVRFNRPIDGVSLGNESLLATTAMLGEPAVGEDDQFEVLPDEPVTDDEEFDSFDEAQTDESPLEDMVLYLPVIVR